MIGKHRRGAGIALVGAAAMTLAACSWTQVGGNPQRTGANPYAPGVQLSTLDDLTTAWTSADHGALADEVIVRDGHAVFAGDQALWSVDSATGADQWHVDRTFDHQSNSLFAVSTWSSGGSTTVAMPQSFYNSVPGTAYFTSTAAVTTVDLATGVPGATQEPGGGYAPLATDRWVYFPHVDIEYGPAGGGSLLVEVVARALDGGASFRVDLSDGLAITSGLATDGTTLFITTRAGLAAIPTTGCGQPQCAPAWTVPFGSGRVFGPVAVGPDAVYVLDRGAGTLWSLPRVCPTATCAPKWKSTLGFAGTGLATAHGSVYVTYGDTLAAYPAGGCGAATCTPTWTSKVAGSGELSEPTLVNDVVFAGSPDGDLLAWDAAGCGAATCAPAWSSPQGGPVGPVSPVSKAIVFRVGGAVRKLELPS